MAFYPHDRLPRPAREFGVLAPSTNTSVQPEFDAMRPWGVTNHHSRLIIPTRASPTTPAS